MSDTGIRLLPPYLGESGALTGSARRVEEARARRAEVDRLLKLETMRENIEQRRRKAEAEIAQLRAQVEAEEAELRRLSAAEDEHLLAAQADLAELIASRRG